MGAMNRRLGLEASVFPDLRLGLLQEDPPPCQSTMPFPSTTFATYIFDLVLSQVILCPNKLSRPSIGSVGKYFEGKRL